MNAAANPRLGESLREALIELNKYGIGLMFSSELVEPWMRVDITSTADDPLLIARQILASHQLDLFEGPAGRWIVTRAPNQIDSSQVMIFGSVIDATSGLEVIGAEVVTNFETVESDSIGIFSITAQLPIEVAINADGYEAVSYVIADDLPIEILLQREGPRFEELTVVASRYLLFSGDPSAQLNHSEIDRLPHLADDMARAIGRLPATTANDFSARFNVRGGWNDEITMRIDGLDLVDPFHIKDMQGSFSIIDSNLIERVEVLPGGYPAKYGDSTSGVVNIATMSPPEKAAYSVGLSITNLFANGRGSFNNNEGGWLLSARRGFLDWIFNRLESGPGRFTPRYNDVLGKIEHTVGDRHTVFAEFLSAQDDFYYLDDTDVTLVDGDSSSLSLWTRLESHWSDSLRSEFVLWRSKSDRIRDNLVDVTDNLTGTVLDIRDMQELGLRSDWHWRSSDQWQFEFGAELKDYRGAYVYSLVSRTTSVLFPAHLPIDRRVIVDVEGVSYSAYAAARRNFGRLTAELGWRWDEERYTGRDENFLSPRFNLSYDFGERGRFTASWGRFAQFQPPGSLQVEDGVDKFFPATRSEHRLLGVEYLLDRNIRFRAEAYQKIYRHLRSRFTNLFDDFKPIPEAKPDRVIVDATSAEAYGVELTLNQQSDVFSWRGSYVFSEVTDRVDGIDIARDWNQRHALDFILNWQGARWNFNIASRWHSGWPRTDATAGLIDTPTGLATGVLPGERNAGRNNNYFRVDTRISRDVKLKGGQLTYFFEVYNLFDRGNNCCIDFELTPSSQLRSNNGNWLPRFPSLGFSWTFK